LLAITSICIVVHPTIASDYCAFPIPYIAQYPPKERAVKLPISAQHSHTDGDYNGALEDYKQAFNSHPSPLQQIITDRLKPRKSINRHCCISLLAITSLYLIVNPAIAIASDYQPSPTLYLAQESQEKQALKFAKSGFAKQLSGNYQGAVEDYNQAISLQECSANALGLKFAEVYRNRRLLKQQHFNDPKGALADYNNDTAFFSRVDFAICISNYRTRLTLIDFERLLNHRIQL
jgi:tetratricopeptide (TPR) repeat protein